MSLSENAKTFYELGKKWMETKVDDSINNEAWVRLSDAQQEIDGLWIQIRDHRKTIEKLETERKTLADFQKRERGLLKQKLEPVFAELDFEDKWHVNPIMNRVRVIIKDLLK